MDAGEPDSAFARMIAVAIAERASLHLREAAEHVHAIAVRLQRLQRRAEFEAHAVRGGSPTILDRAGRMVDEPEPRAGFARARGGGGHRRNHGDRKSTRLNSSHGYISYAVFCLKKKKQ